MEPARLLRARERGGIVVAGDLPRAAARGPMRNAIVDRPEGHLTGLVRPGRVEGLREVRLGVLPHPHAELGALQEQPDLFPVRVGPARKLPIEQLDGLPGTAGPEQPHRLGAAAAPRGDDDLARQPFETLRLAQMAPGPIERQAREGKGVVDVGAHRVGRLPVREAERRGRRGREVRAQQPVGQHLPGRPVVAALVEHAAPGVQGASREQLQLVEEHVLDRAACGEEVAGRPLQRGMHLLLAQQTPHGCHDVGMEAQRLLLAAVHRHPAVTPAGGV